MPLSPGELPDYLQHFIDKVSSPAGRKASDAMVHKFDDGIKRNELIRHTGAPSPPGQPPALETGRLRDSLRIVPAHDIGAFRWQSSDAPHTVYAHIQEYGGDIYPRVKKWLHWVD